MSALQQSAAVPEPAQPWLRAVLGNYRSLSAHRVGSQRTGVWKVHSHGDDFFFKLHYDRQLWYSEVTAYQRWALAYEPYIPQVVALFDENDRQGMLLTAILGRPLKECHFDESTTTEVYRQAGRLCKRLQDLPAGNEFGLINEQGVAINYQEEPLGESATDPVAFVRDNLEYLFELAQAHNTLERNELAQVQEALASIEVFRHEIPTLVNTDFTSNNWLVDRQGKLVGIIDLEHLFRNVAADAFTRLLFANYQPGLLAFFEGYGGNPLATKGMQLRIVCLRQALYFIADGAKLKNASWIARGREIFRQLDDLLAQVT